MQIMKQKPKISNSTKRPKKIKSMKQRKKWQTPNSISIGKDGSQRLKKKLTI